MAESRASQEEEDTGDEEAAEEAAAMAEALQYMDLEELDEDTRQLVLEAMAPGSGADTDDDDVSAAQAPTMPGSRLQSTGGGREQAGLGSTAGPAEDQSGMLDREELPGPTATSQALPHAQGPSQSLLTAQLHPAQVPESEVPPAAAGAETRHDAAAGVHLESAAAAVADTTHDAAAIHLEPEAGAADDDEWYDRWDEDYFRTKHPEAFAAAVKASQSWSRIVRVPRKKGKHVLLDVCTACGPDSAPASQGALLQQVVAAADRRRWLGPAGYRLARKSRWGDLWPAYYQKHAINHKDRSK